MSGILYKKQTRYLKYQNPSGSLTSSLTVPINEDYDFSRDPSPTQIDGTYDPNSRVYYPRAVTNLYFNPPMISLRGITSQLTDMGKTWRRTKEPTIAVFKAGLEYAIREGQNAWNNSNDPEREKKIRNMFIAQEYLQKYPQFKFDEKTPGALADAAYAGYYNPQTKQFQQPGPYKEVSTTSTGNLNTYKDNEGNTYYSHNAPTPSNQNLTTTGIERQRISQDNYTFLLETGIIRKDPNTGEMIIPDGIDKYTDIDFTRIPNSIPTSYDYQIKLSDQLLNDPEGIEELQRGLMSKVFKGSEFENDVEFKVEDGKLIVRIKNKPDSNFSIRERTINEEIHKNMKEFVRWIAEKGFIRELQQAQQHTTARKKGGILYKLKK